ncbi:calcium-translocating P-type ATPase, PMCA-type [Clostridiaceae bacterium 35-E11]
MKSYHGLTSSEVESSRLKFGTNQLTPQQGETFFDKLKGNLGDPIIKILIVALFLNVVFAFMGKAEWYESAGIALAVLLATLISTWSEHSNESSFQKLQEDAAKIKVKVYRNGKTEEILIDHIVVGDLVILQSGDKIPADGKLIEGSLKVDQAVLNGESKEATKRMRPMDYQEPATVDFLDEYKLFRGTVVVSGEGIFEVTTVGDSTFYGQLAQEMKTEDRESPLKVKLTNLADGISKFGYIGGVLIALAFLFEQIVIKNSFDSAQIMYYLSDWTNPINDLVGALILAIIIIVMAVPEGLPMMIAMVLSMNMRKMLKDNVLVRKLVGIETAGSLNILFSDKTGTITKGQLETVTFINGENKQYSRYTDIPAPLQTFVALSITKNTNSMVGEKDSKGQYKIIGGNGTEKAVLGFVDHSKQLPFEVETVTSIPFNSENKFSATQICGDFNLTLIKGAPEKLIDKCDFFYDEKGQKQVLTKQSRELLTKKMDELAHKAIRILALTTTEEELLEDKVFQKLTFVGILGIRDDVRPEAVTAIKRVQEAGVQVVMITGDRKETAIAIAKDSGLLTSEDQVVLTSDELQKMSDDELKKMLPKIRVIARALPTDKSRLVKISQESNLVVGMTGDGVNDAPALKKADVGFAMGSGTEVAKEAGDIVILDDNFNSISKAVLYGRTIYHSIRKFIIFQLTINVSAVLISFIGPFIGIDHPLSITQILWVNLIMDTLAALAFGGEPALERYMKEKPKRRDERIVSKDMWSAILTSGIYTTVMSLIFLSSDFIHAMFRASDEKLSIYLMTGFFSFFVLNAMANGFNSRTESINIFDNITKNPGFLRVMGLIVGIQIFMTFIGGEILRVEPLTLQEWGVVTVLSLLIIPVNTIRKIMFNKKEVVSKSESIHANI